MFTSCIFCHREFEENDSLEYLRHGRRIAFDPGRGRLWTRCTACRGWTLAPIDRRWEALEELERLMTDRGRMLAETDNIALIQVADLEVVRVGRANMHEEAWWRYGREFERRRKRHEQLKYAGYAGFGALALTGAVSAIGGGFAWWWGMKAAGRFPEFGRFLKFGRTAWRGTASCPVCGAVLHEIPFKQRGQLVLASGGSDEPTVAPMDRAGLGDEPPAVPSLLYRCAVCTSRGDLGRFQLSGASGEHALRRILAYHNYAGGSDEDLKRATGAIEEHGSPRQLAGWLSMRRTSLGRLDRQGALALEIAMNEEVERQLLEMELAELEARWRAAEEIAAIADGELTPVSGFRRLLGIERRPAEGAGS